MTAALSDIRQKYPQYNDMSDQQLADALYTKYYSDMPKDEYYQKVGIQNTPSYLDDTASLIKTVTNTGSPADLLNTGKMAVNDARDMAQGAVKGLGNTGQFLNQYVESPIARGLLRVVGQKDLANKINAPDVDFNQVTSPIGSGQDNARASVMRGIGQALPAAATGGNSILGQMISYGLSGAANADPNQQNLWGLLPKGRTGAAIENMIPVGLSSPAVKAMEMARPSNILRGTLSKEQLADNLTQTAGTNTSLGSVLQNKSLQNITDNVAPNIPLSGAGQALQNTGNQVRNIGQNLLDKMLGENSPQDVQGALQQSLTKASNAVQAEKRAKYAALDKAAGDSGLAVGSDNLQQAAKDKLNSIMQSPNLARETPSSVHSDLQFYANGGHDDAIDPATGLVIKGTDDLKSSDIFRGILGDKAQQAYENNDMYQYGIYKDLKDAKQKDIEDAIDTSPNQNIKQLRDDAHNFYRENVVPFEDPEVLKFTKQGGDPDMLINTFLKTSRVADRSRLLSKLVDKLPPDQKGLVPYAYYSRALDGDKLNPEKLATLHNNLGNQQENVLFSNNKDLQKQMGNYVGLVQKNKEPLNVMFNPKTGARNSAWALPSLMYAGATLGHSIMGPVGAPIGAAIGATAPGMLMRPVMKALTSESVRNSLVKNMLESQPKFNNPDIIRKTQILTQGLLNALQQGNGR
jgi:hypothetical protein